MNQKNFFQLNFPCPQVAGGTTERRVKLQELEPVPRLAFHPPHTVARWSNILHKKTHTKIINYRQKLEAERPVILQKGPTFYFHELLCFQAHF